jgi:hypothetical protein
MNAPCCFLVEYTAWNELDARLALTGKHQDALDPRITLGVAV